MSASICFVFEFLVCFKFRLLYLFNIHWFPNVLCAFGLQVVQFLVILILKVHLEDARRKKECLLFSGFCCLKFRAGRFEYSIDR